MKESTRTMIFGGVAVVSAALAWFVHAGSRSEEPEAYTKVGTEFYPEFTDPTKAGSLEITNYDEKAKRSQHFKVEFQNGRWRIPSHHGYPADAEDRLEKAAASLIGVTRKSVAGRRANAHERFGVLAPPSADAQGESEALDGVGQRIVVKDKNGSVLADYILGKRVAGQDNLYFVRTPDEDETYHAEIELDVSTKFADWIEKDLLKLNRSDLLSMELKTPKFEVVQTPFGAREALVGEDSVKVFRPETGTGTDWQIADLKAETEEINTTGVGSVQTGLDSLELKGVRPKPQGLTPNLQVNLDAFPKDQDPQQHFRDLGRELSSRGFMLAMPQKDEAEEKYLLFGDGGELIARTNEGLAYHLHFGKAFNGTEEEIEVGKTDIADEKGEDVKESKPEDSSDSKTTLNRFLFIRVEFDDSLLGNAPLKPTEPEKPEALKDAADADAPPKDDKDKTPEELEQDKLQREYDSKLALYKSELATYEEDNKEYQEKLKKGKAKVDELNNRFANWYYVIPATSYENLVFTRADVVKEKETPKDEPEDPSAKTPGPSALDDFLKGLPGGKTPPPETEPATAEKPPAKAEAAPEPK